MLQRGPEVCSRSWREVLLHSTHITFPFFSSHSPARAVSLPYASLIKGKGVILFPKGKRSASTQERDLRMCWGGDDERRRRWSKGKEKTKKSNWCGVRGYKGLLKLRETKQWKGRKSLLASIAFRVFSDGGHSRWSVLCKVTLKGMLSSSLSKRWNTHHSDTKISSVSKKH